MSGKTANDKRTGVNSVGSNQSRRNTMTHIYTRRFYRDVDLARNRNPEFKEELLCYEDIRPCRRKGPRDLRTKQPFPRRCPNCCSGTVTLYGITYRELSWDWRKQVPEGLCPNPWEMHHVHLFECRICERRYILQYGYVPPET